MIREERDGRDGACVPAPPPLEEKRGEEALTCAMCVGESPSCREMEEGWSSAMSVISTGNNELN